MRNLKYIDKYPDVRGYFGSFGGKFVPETLIPALTELESAFKTVQSDDSFLNSLNGLLKNYAGRPTPLYFAKNLSEYCGNVNIYFKREDLLHTGAHKINNALGQALLAKYMHKNRIIAETGAGQHGVATATVAALFAMQCIVYMGETDMERQAPNVLRMKLLGAEVRPVYSGTKTLKDATNEAIRDWVSNVRTTFYIIGSVVGPHPYPMIVREFQRICSKEAKEQFQKDLNLLPDTIIACVGGGSNAIGIFYEFLDDDVELIGVEAAGFGLNTQKHAATLNKGRHGILHGALSKLLQNEDGQVCETHSVSAGLDYPGVGPEHAFLQESKRVRYESVTDDQALSAFRLCSEMEGIIPALESSHALAYVLTNKNKFKPGVNILINLSGRGDKDLQTVLGGM